MLSAAVSARAGPWLRSLHAEPLVSASMSIPITATMSSRQRLKDRLSPSGKTYFFLDEVQELKDWEKVVNVEILLCAGFQLKVGNYLSCGE